ncbi:DUF2480 family protein [Rubrivirga sp. S365]|uniref:DUF2480 family protein n=1 Tax=Rubrivirga litoralis TaxID=3075598 RepID=A0ABU3BR35_9BACT|nr:MULTISPECIES: DUF2480 family protein [unclassified Rubrivirga]MDT0631751.1 DUF2480 family protein [Rubrivirga sp. F394]MDT7856084.1 DUF2480 family protein [Rubrivirga sp. S365]
MDTAPLVNRVAESAIETLDLAAIAPAEDVVAFDLAPHLYRGLVLREREFRQALKDHDWTAYAGRDVAVFCSADALVPTWAFMLVAAKLGAAETGAASVTAAPPEEVRRARFAAALDAADWDRYAGKPVVVKGCGNDVVPLDGFVQATRRLQGVASKVLYGEACSSVPVWRRPAPGAGAPGAGGAGRPAKPAAAKPVGVKPAGVKPAGPPRG